MPLYVGFCHVQPSPTGDASLHFALSTEGFATVLPSDLSNCGPLYLSKGETGNASHHSFWERHTVLEEFKYQKV